MAIQHNKFQTLKDAIKHLEEEKFECVVYPNNWISADMAVNAKIIPDYIVNWYSIEYLA